MPDNVNINEDSNVRKVRQAVGDTSSKAVEQSAREFIKELQKLADIKKTVTMGTKEYSRAFRAMGRDFPKQITYYSQLKYAAEALKESLPEVAAELRAGLKPAIDEITKATKDYLPHSASSVEALRLEMESRQAWLETIGKSDQSIKSNQVATAEADVAAGRAKMKYAKEQKLWLAQNLQSRNQIWRSFGLQTTAVADKMLKGMQMVFGPELTSKLTGGGIAIARLAGPMALLIPIINSLFGNFKDMIGFVGAMQQFGGVAGRASQVAGMRSRMLTESIGTFLSAKQAQEAYTMAVDQHLYTLADANEVTDQYGNLQRISIQLQRELMVQTARTTFQIQALGKSIGLDQNESIKSASIIYNRFRVDIDEVGERMMTLHSLSQQMQISFLGVLDPLAKISEKTQFVDMGFETLVGNATALTKSMLDLQKTGDSWWADIKPEQSAKVFSTALESMMNMSEEMIIAMKGGLAPGQTLGAGIVEAMETGPIQRGILAVRRMTELGMGQFGESTKEQAAVMSKMFPGLTGPVGLRVTESLMKAADKFGAPELMSMQTPDLIEELKTMQNLTVEEREAFGKQLNAMSKEPLEHITDILQKMLSLLQNIATAKIFGLKGGSAVESMISRRTGIERATGGIREVEIGVGK